MELRQWEVNLTNPGRSVMVKAYGISYHRTHTAFTGFRGETVVAYRSDDVLSIRKVTLT